MNWYSKDVVNQFLRFILTRCVTLKWLRKQQNNRCSITDIHHAVYEVPFHVLKVMVLSTVSERRTTKPRPFRETAVPNVIWYWNCHHSSVYWMIKNRTDILGYFMQDNEISHTVNNSILELEEVFDVRVTVCGLSSPRSPDLKFVTFLWGKLK
jgi:hypothetical protein